MSEKTSFEKNMEQLEKIAERLESGEAGLDEALKLFSDGVKISAECSKMLDSAEQQVNILLKNDSMKQEAFTPEAEK